jgi:hypothetical protein
MQVDEGMNKGNYKLTPPLSQNYEEIMSFILVRGNLRPPPPQTTQTANPNTERLILIKTYSSAPVPTGNTFQDLPRFRETADNTESYIHGDQEVFVHLMITIQKVTSNVQSVPRQYPDIY